MIVKYQIIYSNGMKGGAYDWYGTLAALRGVLAMEREYPTGHVPIRVERV